MYKVIKMSGKVYAVLIDENREPEKNLNEIFLFPKQGNPVVIVDDLNDLKVFDINVDEIILV